VSNYTDLQDAFTSVGVPFSTSVLVDDNGTENTVLVTAVAFDPNLNVVSSFGIAFVFDPGTGNYIRVQVNV
jgi:hypothetical protein